MKLDHVSEQIYIVALNEAKMQSHEYLTPEHIVHASLFFDASKKLYLQCGADIEKIKNELQHFFNINVPKKESVKPNETIGLTFVFENAAKSALQGGRQALTIADILFTILNQQDMYASYILISHGVTKENLSKALEEDDEAATIAAAKNKEIAFLEQFATNLTKKAAEGHLDPLIGREDILERTVQVLLRRTKNNPIHVGEPGVGKTALVEGLASLIANKKVNKKLKGFTIYNLDLSLVVAGTKYRGDFEERFKRILEILKTHEKTIIYIDEIHTVIGSGAVNGSSMDASNLLKPYLSKGELRFIGSTTYDEYKKHFQKDAGLSRRFQKIDVPEPTMDETVKILKGVKDKYANYHNVLYSDAILLYIAELSRKYIKEKFEPDKSLDVLDETGAFLSYLRNNDEKVTVTKKHIDNIIAKIARVPVESISETESDKLLNLDKNLKSKIFGQDEALDIITSSIKKSRAGLSNPLKPVASLLFVGPTGVGKTEACKILSSTLEIPLIRFDMSEYQEKHTVARLIGSPPGYVGHEQGGLLTDEIKKNPHAVLLLDEIEKAHPDIFNVLLQVMDYGTLTDSLGKKTDFSHVILAMTSNAGAKEADKTPIGFSREKNNETEMTKALKNLLSPEFRNRLDHIVTFNSLTEDMAYRITKKAITELADKLTSKNIKINIDENAIHHIKDRALLTPFGAREILRIVEKEITNFLADYILFGNLKNGGMINITIKNDNIKISTRKRGGKSA